MKELNSWENNSKLKQKTQGFDKIWKKLLKKYWPKQIHSNGVNMTKILKNSQFLGDIGWYRKTHDKNSSPTEITQNSSKKLKGLSKIWKKPSKIDQNKREIRENTLKWLKLTGKN